MNKAMGMILEGIIVGVIVTFLSMVLLFLPFINFLVILIPTPFIVVSQRRGIWGGLIGLILFSLLISLFVNPLMGIMMLILNIFIVVLVDLAFKKNYRMNETMILSATAAVASILIALKVFSAMMGESIFEFIWSNMKLLMENNQETLALVLERYHSLGLIDEIYSSEKMINILGSRFKELALLAPSLLLIFSLIFGGLNYIVSRAISQKMGLRVPRIPPFRLWKLPKGTGRGFLGIMVVALVGNLLKIKNFDIVLYTISSIFSFLLMIQGFSVICFYLKEKKVSKFLSVVIMILVLVIFSFLLIFLGMFEQMFNLRRAYRRREGD